MNVVTDEAPIARRLRLAVMTLSWSLIVVLIAWRVATGFAAADGVLIAVLTLPLWIAMPRLLAGHRRTYAWMTLAITPFLVVAITESVANPSARGWAGACLFVAFALFVTLIAYLRATRS